jgi:hypothetical protein
MKLVGILALILLVGCSEAELPEEDEATRPTQYMYRIGQLTDAPYSGWYCIEGRSNLSPEWDAVRVIGDVEDFNAPIAHPERQMVEALRYMLIHHLHRNPGMYTMDDGTNITVYPGRWP